MKHAKVCNHLVMMIVAISCVIKLHGANFEKMLSFSFREEPLVDIINMVATERGVNIVMPAGADAITSKVTLQSENELTIDAAWDMLHTILDVAGYSIVLRGSMYAIVKNSKALIKEPVPLYIGVPADQLPDTDQRIRYLYYLSNMKIAEEQGPEPSELDQVLRSILSDTGAYKTDPKTNAVLIIDKADTIKAVMKVIAALDQATFRERLEIIKLRHVNADVVAQLFEESILKTDRDPQRYGLRDRKPLEEASYFSRQVRPIAEVRTNTLILVGREQAVLRVKEFIEKYIDVELDSGQSILHVYQLQYLDVGSFAPVLENIVKSARFQGTGQSVAEQQQQGGTERFFEGVIIKTDKPQGADDRSEPGEGVVKYSGGNKLIIAAKNDDWKIIKPLIEELDKPQRTVIIEVLIVDLTSNDARILGTSLRVPDGLPMPAGVNMQTVHITPQPILNLNPTPPPTITVPESTLATDLLQQTQFPAGSGNTTNAAAIQGAGSTVLSFSDASDGKTWGIMQLLQNFVHSKILSHPHVVATNNSMAIIKVGEERLLQDEAVSAVAPVVKFKPKSANLEVKIIPRISSSDSVSLNIFVDITEYVEGNSNAQITRNLSTLAEVHTGSVLALGGLIRVGAATGLSETPILSKIPILGWLFKRRSSANAKTNLTVFISPTIVEPRLRGGAGEYTVDHLNIAQRYAQESENFDSLRDPITRFFFKDPEDDKKIVRSFLAKDEFKVTEAVLAQYGHENDTKKEELYIKKKRPALKKRPPLAAPLEKTPIVETPLQALPMAALDRDAQLKKLLEGTDNPLARV